MAALFGNLFDFDGNGELDSFEKAAELDFLYNMEREEESERLSRAGIDPEKLEYMPSTQRRQILAHAGLDPDDYDF